MRPKVWRVRTCCAGSASRRTSSSSSPQRCIAPRRKRVLPVREARRRGSCRARGGRWRRSRSAESVAGQDGRPVRGLPRRRRVEARAANLPRLPRAARRLGARRVERRHGEQSLRRRRWQPSSDARDAQGCSTRLVTPCEAIADMSHECAIRVGRAEAQARVVVATAACSCGASRGDPRTSVRRSDQVAVASVYRTSREAAPRRASRSATPRRSGKHLVPLQYNADPRRTAWCGAADVRRKTPP